MADPLRRTILAKLRGKKSKKDTTAGGGGHGHTAANGAREGKEKVLQVQANREARPLVLLAELDCMTERMSSYENYIDGMREIGGFSLARENGAICVPAATHVNNGSEGVRQIGAGRAQVINEERSAVPLQRDDHVGGSVDRKYILPAGEAGQKKHLGLLVPVPLQYSNGDSIGFGDNYNRVLDQTAPDKTGFGQNESARHIAGRSAAVNERTRNVNVNHTNSNQSLEAHAPPCTTLVLPSTADNAEETMLIRNIESYGSCGYSADVRFTSLQSPTFFPTELEICDVNMASTCAGAGTLALHCFDSEDEDYYDNEILPFYESLRVGPNDANNRTGCQVLAPGRPAADHGRLGDVTARETTDRLRCQLKEAYCLLINAMHDISLDVEHLGGAVGDRRHNSGNRHRAPSSCSSRSRESLCSRRSTRNTGGDSDSWSSGGGHSSRRAASDTVSLLLLPQASPAGEGSEPGLMRHKSKSTATLPLEAATSSSSLPRRARSCEALAYRHGGTTGSADNDEAREVKGRLGEAAADTWGLPREGYDASGSEGPLGGAEGEVEVEVGEEGRDREGPLDKSGGSSSSLTGSSDHSTGDPQGPHGVGLGDGAPTRGPDYTGAAGHPGNKGHGVTVNKMQEWMHRGRLLSSEMKQRIEGSAGPGARGHELVAKATVSPSKAPGLAATPTTTTTTQPELLENVQRPGDGGELPPLRPPPPNAITVSKKRNWLQQSSLAKGPASRDGPQCMLGAKEEEGEEGEEEEEGSPSHDNLRPLRGVPVRPLRLHLLQVPAGPGLPRRMDPAEENDADDEGEIWYNPIPEDEDPTAATHPPHPHQPAPQGQRRVGQAGGSPEQGRSSTTTTTGGGGGRTEEGLAGRGGAGEVEQGTAEAMQLHRPMLLCKTQEGAGLNTTKATDGPDLFGTAGISSPSSPSPAKKVSSINWSFPDKIKSPRTVRKISMRMKKLPELSRKLSVKGPSSSSGSNGGSGGHPDSRVPPPPSGGPEPPSPPRSSSPSTAAAASRNVIWRYHLDSSVSTQHGHDKKKSGGGSGTGVSKSASKGGYLSDGDSPELVAKSAKHGAVDAATGTATSFSKHHGAELDADAFRHYSFGDQPKCGQHVSGLMSLHLCGAAELRLPRTADSRDVYCAIQVDQVNKARTALLPCRASFLDMDHTFNIELENAQHLKLTVFSWEPAPRRRHRVCCHGSVALPPLFRARGGQGQHKLAVKLEPCGLIYVKLSLMEQWQNSVDGGGPRRDREPWVFGVEAWRVVEREASGLPVPLLVEKCIGEIEKRGCQVVGLYRLCGSAAVKKELREAFERDSYAVELCENTYPDINVITGVLKDYLRELPQPLITRHLYEAVLEAMARRPLRMGAAGCENDRADSDHTVGLLDHLPEVERVTLRKLLDHLKLVASHQDLNKMTCQNLAVCFGPVLLSQRQEASCHTNRVFIDSEELASALHFKKHIEVLHYLLQLWPVVDPRRRPDPPDVAAPAAASLPLRRRKERPQVLNLGGAPEAAGAGVRRPRPGRLDSPSNRYAGDWSQCGESYFPTEPLLAPPGGQEEEADYDDVARDDAEGVEGAEDTERVRETRQDCERTCHVLSPLPGPLANTTVVPGSPEDEEAGGEGGEGREEEVTEEEDGRGEKEEEERDEEVGKVCDHILPPRHPAEHAYQAYVKIQDMSPALHNRVNLRDLQESIDALIGSLEMELSKSRLAAGY